MIIKKYSFCCSCSPTFPVSLKTVSFVVFATIFFLLKPTTVQLHSLIKNRKLRTCPNTLWCVSGVVAHCFCNVHLERFQNRYSNRVIQRQWRTKCQKKLSKQNIPPCRIVPMCYQQFLQNFGGKKKGVKKKYTTSHAGYWGWWLPFIESFPFSACLFIHLSQQKCTGHLLCARDIALKNFK